MATPPLVPRTGNPDQERGHRRQLGAGVAGKYRTVLQHSPSFPSILPLVSVSIWFESSIPRTLILPLFCQLVGSFSGGTDPQRPYSAVLRDMLRWSSLTRGCQELLEFLCVTTICRPVGKAQTCIVWEANHEDFKAETLKVMFVYEDPQCTVRETAPQGR